MNKMIFYNRMHVSAEDLGQIYEDLETAYVQHLQDFHTNKTEFVLGSTAYGANSLKVSATPFASLTVSVSGGVGYYGFERIENPPPYSYVVGDIPADSGGGLNVTRIDLLYIEKQIDESASFSIDFIDSNRNIYQETKYTRYLDGYNFDVLQGTYNIGGGTAPTIPSGVIPLAYIHLRDATNKIYNTDTGSLNEGYIEDLRTVVDSQII